VIDVDRAYLCGSVSLSAAGRRFTLEQGVSTMPQPNSLPRLTSVPGTCIVLLALFISVHPCAASSTGWVAFLDRTGGIVETYPPGSDSIYVDLYDPDLVGGGTHAVTIASPQDTETVILNELQGQGGAFQGRIALERIGLTGPSSPDLEARLTARVSELRTQNPGIPDPTLRARARAEICRENPRQIGRQIGRGVERSSELEVGRGGSSPFPRAPEDGRLQAAIGDTIRITYEDAANGYGSPQTIAASAIFGGISGDLTGVWTRADSPYIVVGYAQVPRGDSLRIESGVEVRLAPSTEIDVLGRLTAEGTEQDSIHFKGFGSDSLSNWDAIYVAEEAAAVFRFCDFRGRDTNLILSDRASVILDRTRTESMGTGINISGMGADSSSGSILIDGCVVRNNETGISIQGKNVSIVDCRIVENDVDGIDIWYGGGSMTGCAVTDNGMYGIQFGMYIAGAFAVNDTEIHDNGGSVDVFVGAFESGNAEIDMRHCDWGPVTTAEMNAGGNPKNISRIYDHWDNSSVMFANYSNWAGSVFPVGHSGTVELTDASWDPIGENIPSHTEHIYVQLSDADIAGVGSHDVSITSGDDSETLTLSELPDQLGIFQGSIALQQVTGPALTSDGILQVSPGAIVRVTYQDAMNDYGSSRQVMDSAIYAATSGSVTGTWAKADSPILISGNITVPERGSLLIEPGVEVLFNGPYSFDVRGSLIAEGSDQDTIRFGPSDTFNEHWQGITASSPTTEARLRFCEIRRANIGALFLDGELSLARSRIHANSMGLSVFMQPYDSVMYRVVVDSCLIQDNGGGITLGEIGQKERVIIHDSRIERNSGYGITGWSGSAATITGCAITDNLLIGIYLYQADAGAFAVNDCELHGNQGDYDVSLEWFTTGSEMDMRHCNWGAATTAEMNAGGNPKNITRIYDSWDNPSLPRVNYSDWIGSTIPVGHDGAIAFTDAFWTPIGGGVPAGTDSIHVGLVDLDLAGIGTYQISITSAGDAETMTLTENGGASGVYHGAMGLQQGAPNPSDGILQVAVMGAIEVVYQEARDSYGNPRTLMDSAIYGGISGNVQGTWHTENSPLMVVGDVTVPEGGLLRIEQGVEVLFTGPYRLMVSGILQTNGTALNPIRFAAAAGAVRDSSGSWEGIQQSSSSGGSVLRYCEIRDASTGITVTDGNCSLQYCTIHFNRDLGVSLANMTADSVYQGITVYNSTIRENGAGILIHDVAGPLYPQPTVRIGASRIEENLGTGLTFGFDGNGEVRSCQIVGNGAPGVVISGGYTPRISIRDGDIHDNAGDYDVVVQSAIPYGDIDMTSCYWGDLTTAEIESGANPKNLSRIWDHWDDPGQPVVNYSEWRNETTPIELSGLAARVDEDGVRITWRPMEGIFRGFYVERAPASDPAGGIGDAGYSVLNPDAPIPAEGPWEYVDDTTTPGEAYAYRISATMVDGSTRVYGPIAATAPAARAFALLPAAPNPIRDQSLIRFDLPAAGLVRLQVFDISGRCVAHLVDGQQKAGRHRIEWDGRDDSGHSLPSGIYCARLESQGRSAVRRVLILR
jgi:hypothetical protein